MSWDLPLQSDSATPDNSPPWIEYLYESLCGTKPVQCWMASAPFLDIPFDEAIRRVGPKTFRYAPGERAAVMRRGEIPVEPLIWQAGKLYEAEHAVTPRRATVVLANFGNRENVTISEVLLWAEVRELSAAFPFEVFSVCAALPDLHKKLRCDPACIASTEERCLDGVWRAPCVRMGSVEREVAFIPSRYPLHDSYWFAFRTRETRQELATRKYEQFFGTI